MILIRLKNIWNLVCVFY